MSLWVLDTDTVTLLLHGHANVVQRTSQCAADELATTIVTGEELMTGWYAQVRRARTDAALVSAYRALQERYGRCGAVSHIAIGPPAQRHE